MRLQKKDYTGQKFGKLTAISSFEKDGKTYWNCECECGSKVEVEHRCLPRRIGCDCVLRVDLAGKKFGLLTVLEYAGNRDDARKSVQWLCKCDCGKEKIVSGNNLKSKNTISCGCLIGQYDRKPPENIAGKIFGKLKVIEQAESNNGRVWKCECECGQTRIVHQTDLEKGIIKHCLDCNRDKTYLIGKKFGTLEVVSFEKVSNFISFWRCSCSCGSEDCKKSLVVCNSGLVSDKLKNRTCRRGRAGKESKVWKGYGDISGNRWRSIKHDAKRRNIKFELTIENAWNVFEKQNSLCALTGEEIYFGKESKDIKHTASLDRINNKDFYHQDNIWWVHKDINNIKNKLSVEELLYWANLVTNKDKSEYIFSPEFREMRFNWNGYKLINGGHWNRIVKQAEKRGISVEITIQDIWELFEKQGGRCGLTNLPLILMPGSSDRLKQTASLDRIDSSKGYIKGNLSWIHKQLNMIKWEYTEEYFKEMCSKIYEYNKDKYGFLAAN